MKKISKKGLFGFFLSFLVASSALATDAKTAQTETLLINKLTNVFLRLPEGNPTKNKITLRLADLHAERGRLVAKQELEKGCIECSNGIKDRKKALEYYQYVLPGLKGEARQNVMVQVGHIYEILGDNAKAIQFYKKVIAGASGKGAAEAQFSLAEIYFKQRDFAAAKKYYTQALNNNQFTRRGLATFRRAWCFYNLGEVASAVKALETILSDPKLLTRGGENLVNVDQDFKSEVAKDYTVFMAHSSQISMNGIQKVYKLSPDKTRIENVSFLAKELERLGQIEQAQQAWELVVAETGDPQIRMEGLVYLAGLQMKGSQKAKILPYLKRAFRNWASLKACKDQRVCDELKKRIRTLVFDWNRSEKKSPSNELLEAYEGYFTVEKTDREGYVLASQAAIQAKDFSKAWQWNKQAFQLASTDEQKERALLRRIEIAELAKNSDWLAAAQKTYLQDSPKKTKSTEIRYQMAQQAYDSKNYQSAADQFKAIASEPNVKGKLKIQAAEMALDALVLTQDDKKIEAWAGEFAQTFPSQRKHFLSLAGTSVLSQTASISATGSDNQKAWQTLNRFDVGTADAEKKKTYFKNKVILARKLKKFNEMDSALRSFLALKNLTKDETKFGLENRVWLSELQLDFDAAFQAYKKLETGNWLEMARMADLAEKPSAKYYYKYLQNPEDKDLAFSICVKLVKEAKQLGAKQKPCLPYLSTDKTYMAALIMEIYSGKKSNRQLSQLLKRHGLQKTPAYRVLEREFLIAEGEAKIKKLVNHKLDGRTARVAGSLQRRMALITSFEQTISKATKTEDWLTQTLFLTELQKQYTRFFEELMALPTPQDLSAEEQQQYLTLLSQQAAPYKEKASQIQFKIDELWKNEAAVDQVFANFHRAPKEIQTILGPQIEKMKAVSAPKRASQFDLVFRSAMTKKTPSLALLETARNQVKSSPLNKSALQNLIQLEMKRGYEPMIIYLNSRLKMVDQGFETSGRSL